MCRLTSQRVRYAAEMDTTDVLTSGEVIDYGSVLAWAEAVCGRLRAGGSTVLEVPFVERPATSGLIVIEPDDEGAAILVGIAQKLDPPLVLYVDDAASDSAPSLDFHLTWSGSWVTVECMLGVHAGGQDDEGEPELSDVRKQELDERTAAVVDQLIAEDQPRGHGSAFEVRDAILALTTADEALSASELGYLRFTGYEAAHTLATKLKDLHQGRFHSDALAFAAQILAEMEIPRSAKMDVIRSAAYRYMKRMDPSCTIKSEMGSICAELEALVRTQ